MKIKTIRVNVVSDIISTNALSTNRVFRFLMKQNFFKEIDRKSLIIWCDCGTHFRSAENMHFFLVELPSQGYSVEINYFGEQHGKNGCDQHFSVISKYLEYESYAKRLFETQVIVNAINSHQSSSNINRVRNNLEPIIVHTLVFIQEDNRAITQNFLKISDLTCYFNFYATRIDKYIFSYYFQP